MRLLECVPNISEGKDEKKIALIAEEVKRRKGVKLLDVSSDKDHHRSVLTFIGEPETIKDAALSMALKAIDLIDMRAHHGAHPRLGAVDVVPFVPIQGVEMKEAVGVAHELAKELGERESLYFIMKRPQLLLTGRPPSIRKGEYEGWRKN
jgi:glutamate formiminotransferase